MAEKIKYTRKDLKGPDEFITTLGRVIEWGREHRGQAIAVIAAVVLLLAGGVGTRAYLAWQEAKASRDLWPHLNRTRELLQAPGEADPQILAQMNRFLASYVTRYPGEKTTGFAQYYLGSIAYLQGDYDRSAAHFRAALGLVEGGKSIMPYLAREGLAEALEAKGDLPAALAAYRDAAAGSTGELRTEPWMGEARVLAAMGKKTESIERYRSILLENPDSPLREEIEIRLARAG
jgi:tetratricopeptide (TPR) repeat protein